MYVYMVSVLQMELSMVMSILRALVSLELAATPGASMRIESHDFGGCSDYRH